MNYYELQITSWDDHCFSEKHEKYKVGDEVIIQTKWGNELARIVDTQETIEKGVEFVAISGVADKEARQKIVKLENEAKEALQYCFELVKKYRLPMKLVASHFSLAKEKLVFAFIAHGRVDFRELLRDLTKRYHGNIRLQQIGVRDEAQINGDMGPCGRTLCCQRHLTKLGNITIDMADKQKLNGRGMERLSGACGRLKCCLAFEGDNRQNSDKNIKVKTNKQK